MRQREFLGRLAIALASQDIVFTWECDLGDGWEDQDVHNDSQATRQKALRMGSNIVRYVFMN